MQATLTSENHRDFRQRHSGTIGFFVKDDKKILVEVSDVTESKVIFRDIKGNEYTAFANKGTVFEFIPVDRGYYNSVNGLIYLERVPARQWQRGISRANTAAKLNGQPVSVSLKTINGCFGSENIPMNVAIDNWKTGKVDHLALSKFFCFLAGKVFFGQKTVGTVDKDIGVILDGPIIFQELGDTLRRLGIDLPVTVKESQ